MARLFGCHGSRRTAAAVRVPRARLPRSRDHVNFGTTPRETEIAEMSPKDGQPILEAEEGDIRRNVNRSHFFFFNFK